MMPTPSITRMILLFMTGSLEIFSLLSPLLGNIREHRLLCVILSLRVWSLRLCRLSGLGGATERKKLVESMDKLLAQARKLAESQYTRSGQRAKWTRLAGQLLWYKDQILRAMTWEALEQDVHRLMRGSTTRWKRGE